MNNSVKWDTTRSRSTTWFAHYSSGGRPGSCPNRDFKRLCLFCWWYHRL